MTQQWYIGAHEWDECLMRNLSHRNDHCALEAREHGFETCYPLLQFGVCRPAIRVRRARAMRVPRKGIP